MHNWRLLLLAFLAVLQPIASFTDRNLVDGRQQCTTRSANRDARLTLYGTTRNSKISPGDRRVNYRETVEARQENQRYEVSDLTPSEKGIVDSREKENHLGPHRESRLHQRDSRLSEHLDRDRVSDRNRESRQDARRLSSATREVREISRSTKDDRHYARDSREFSDRASTTELRAESRNDRISRIPAASRHEERRVRKLTRHPRHDASYSVTQRIGDKVAQIDSSRIREESRLADKSPKMRDDTQRDSMRTQERRSLDRLAESRDQTERRSSPQEMFRDREESRLYDNWHTERASPRRYIRQMDERQVLNRFAESPVFREREESRLANDRRTERASSRRENRQMNERQALNGFSERRDVIERRSVSLENFREREESHLADDRRTERASSRRDTRQMEEQRALDRFAERRGVIYRRSVSLENFREREKTILTDNRRTERVNSRRHSRKMEERLGREQNRREISQRRMSFPETLRVREEISLADGRRTERISSRRVLRESEEQRSLERRIVQLPLQNSRDASRNRDPRDESRISRANVRNEQDSQRMIPMQRLAIEKRETSRVNRERDMRNIARESSDRSAVTRGTEERQARIRSTDAKAIRSERLADNRWDTRLNYDVELRIQKERRSVSKSPRRMNLEASDERKDSRIQRSTEPRNNAVQMQERRSMPVSPRRMNQRENRDTREERRDTAMERSQPSVTRNNYVRMQDRERRVSQDFRIRESSKTRDTRQIQREQHDSNRIHVNQRSRSEEAREIRHLVFERDFISSRQGNEKTSSTPGQISETNWQYLLYTVQGLYLCSILAQMLGAPGSEKKIRSHGFWSATKNIIKVD